VLRSGSHPRLEWDDSCLKIIDVDEVVGTLKGKGRVWPAVTIASTTLRRQSPGTGTRRCRTLHVPDQIVDILAPGGAV
jgi:hypothetical protein